MRLTVNGEKLAFRSNDNNNTVFIVNNLLINKNVLSIVESSSESCKALNIKNVACLKQVL